MKTLQERAWAKLNLALDVGAKRPDGYHEMRLLMQSISLCDDVTVVLDAGRWWADGDDTLPHDDSNLALRAARIYCDEAGLHPDGIEVYIKKRIPTRAGLGGGSADAAAVLRAMDRAYHALSEPELLHVAEQIGSDVPFCVRGGTALAEGRGELLTPLPAMPDCSIVLCQPDFTCSTPALFRMLDEEPPQHHPDLDLLQTMLPDLTAFAPHMENVFEPILVRTHPVYNRVRETLRHCGAVGTMLTGSGSVYFGLFLNEADAAKARTELEVMDELTWVAEARPVSRTDV